jgi:hypothetical protein
MRGYALLVAGLLATALVSPAGARSATGGAAGRGNYTITGSYGGANASSLGNGNIGTSHGVGNSNAATGSYQIEGNGLPTGGSGSATGASSMPTDPR